MNNDVIEQARNAVSKYCITCEESCCKKGLLNITTQEAALIKKKKPKALFLEEWDGSLSITLEPGCTFLENNQCTIYEERPQACRKYPFYQFAKRVVVARCPPTKKGLLDKELEEIRKEGFEVIIT